MKSLDCARLFEHRIFIHFGSTGESRTVSTLRLDEGISLKLGSDGKCIVAIYHGTDVWLPIESFSSEQLALAAFTNLQSLVKRYARYRQLANACKTVIRWFLAPVVGFMVVLALNTAVTSVIVGNHLPTVSPPIPATLSGVAVRPPQSSGSAAMTTASAKPRPDSKALSKALHDGVAANKYSVQLSNGPKGTLYVFSDPLCPYCQRLESQLEKLSADLTVQVFPVSVIGGEDSKKRLAALFCGGTADRGAAWKESIAGRHPSGEAIDCDNLNEVLAANNEFFRAMLFAGTPVILNEQGIEFPANQRAEADNIKSWVVGNSGSNL
ncbi:DsbC family protein [Pseudomonas sp. AB12(2023)]|uniref:DsbC family protein n=1 Tax=Pseudomonas sp. AB12(2023) TaxID=3048597 RepID=UPI002B23E90D|nr:DsbC family protein [Pseudomonas sp. AB12(2023)]MEB0221367.1 DsbC family protein [Pseudomonas sp. AB12(2023)]